MPARNEEFDERSGALTGILESGVARDGSTPPMNRMIPWRHPN